MARYEAGETLASIARTYGCSPPAISYVVSRSRARQTVAPPETKPPSANEPHLVKAEAVAAAPRPAVAPPAVAPAPVAHPVNGAAHAVFGNGGGEPPRPSPTTREARPPLPAAHSTTHSTTHSNGDQRPRLHLSLGNGGAHSGEAQGAERHNGGGHAPLPHHATARDSAPPVARSPVAPDVPERNRERLAPALAEPRAVGFAQPLRRGESEEAPRKDGASFIDRELRARVDGDIAAFLAAFDAALAEDTPESRSGLREATDRLLRAGARTRIELERLEARLPLPRRDDAGRGEPAWRHR